MPSKEVFFRGKAHFFKLLNKGDVTYQCWSTGLYLDDASFALFEDLRKGSEGVEGIKNEVRVTEDGNLVNLKRAWSKTYNGKEAGFTPPVVLDNKNHPWPSDRNVGNGSDIIVKCEYYTFKPPFKKDRGSAIRLVSARIEDLVPYEPHRDFTTDQIEAAKGFAESKPVQYF